MKKRVVGLVGLVAAMMAFAADLEPWALQKKDLLFSEDFKKGLNTNRWSVLKGDWTVQDGALRGVELEKDHHAAVVRCDTPLCNMIIQFDFCFDGGRSFSLSLNDASGHNSRAVVSPTDFILRKDLDKKDYKSFSAVLGECAADFAPGTWHTMLVEYCGPDMIARVDDRIFALGSHPGVDQDRTTMGFPVAGDGVLFDNIKVWSGLPDKNWAGRRKHLAEQQAARPAVVRDPQSAWTVQEAIVRGRLMADDPAFAALVEARAAVQDEIRATYPKTLRKGAAGASERKRLMAEDPAYKELTRKLALARKAEREHEFEKAPDLKGCYEAFLASR